MLPALLAAARFAAPLAASFLPSVIDSSMTASNNAELAEGEAPSEGHPYLAAAAGMGLGLLTHRMTSPFPLAQSHGKVGGAMRSGDPSKATPAASGTASGKPAIVPEYAGNAGIGSPFPALGYDPTGGPAPEPVSTRMGARMPMSPRDEFRRGMAADVRAEPNTPPIVKRQTPGLPYDEANDAKRQIEMNGEMPDMPMGVPGDDAGEMAAWGDQALKTRTNNDLESVRKRMSRY